MSRIDQQLVYKICSSGYKKLFSSSSFPKASITYSNTLNLEEEWNSTVKKCRMLRQNIIYGNLTGRSVLIAIDSLSNEICKIADKCNFLLLYHEAPAISDAARNVYEHAISFVQSLNTDKEMYIQLKAVQSENTLDAVDNHALEMFLLEFENSGTLFDEEQRNVFINKSVFVVKTGHEFVMSANQPTPISLSRCPTPLLGLLEPGQNTILVEEDNLFSKFDDVREASWKVFYKSSDLQEQRLVALINNRHDVASMTGFKTFAEKELCNSVSQSPDTVIEFLNELNKQLDPLVEKEIRAFTKMKRSGEAINLWDIAHYGMQARSQFLEHKNVFQQRFTLSHVISGLDKLSKELFNLQITRNNYKVTDLWHPDVESYIINTCDGKLQGVMYFDFYKRPNKGHRPSLYTLQCGTFEQVPVVALVCNFEKHQLLQFKDIQLLFHEYGHALHSLLGRTKYQHVSGTRCPTDFAEIPSIFLESLISQSKIFESIFDLNSISCDENVSVSNCYNATEYKMQCCYSLIDILLHSNRSTISNTIEIARHAEATVLSHFTIPEQCALHHRFSHLYEYGSNYYSYLNGHKQ